MKKILTILALSVMAITAADAHGYYHGGGCCYRGGGHWIAPAVIGGMIGYGLSRPYYDPVYVTPPPVVYTQPPVVVEQSVVQQPPIGYHWQEMIDPTTNQKKIVLVPN